MGPEELGEDRFLLVLVELGRRDERQVEHRVGVAVDVRLELVEEDGTEVRGAADLGELLEDGGQAGVVLDAVEPDPRHEHLAGGKIPVAWLVEVPQKRQLHGAHAWAGL
jgi:hypothetical protein